MSQNPRYLSRPMLGPSSATGNFLRQPRISVRMCVCVCVLVCAVTLGLWKLSTDHSTRSWKLFVVLRQTSSRTRFPFGLICNAEADHRTRREDTRPLNLSFTPVVKRRGHERPRTLDEDRTGRPAKGVNKSFRTIWRRLRNLTFGKLFR